VALASSPMRWSNASRRARSRDGRVRQGAERSGRPAVASGSASAREWSSRLAARCTRRSCS
jgi:hypothetical protein